MWCAYHLTQSVLKHLKGTQAAHLFKKKSGKHGSVDSHAHHHPPFFPVQGERD